MDRFITTHERDYTWPPTKTQGTKKLEKGRPCYCDTAKAQKKIIKQDPDVSLNWSRLGPMGRLLDPKLYPAKTGPYPETASSKFDQPSTYLKKLEEKYPDLYGTLQSTPIEEIVKRVDDDRMRTTYQMDYTIPVSEETEECEKLCFPKDESDKDCSPKRPKPGERKRKRQKSGGIPVFPPKEARLPLWKSEYQDGIGRLGGSILKSKLHQQKKRIVPSYLLN